MVSRISLKNLYCLICALALVSAPANAAVISGRVVLITDGNTLMLLDTTNLRHKIRLAGIDAPELAQNFGQKARANLSALAFNRQAVADCREFDRYQRELCLVTVSRKDIGLEQVRNGMAWLYSKYSIDQTPQQRADYEQAEFQAKIHRFGLWNSKNPTPPWVWRHGLPEE